jgi:divalent metal cation (Fe/Co/Zn/Cd) transporter
MRRLLDPQDVEFLAAVASQDSSAGNELVARYRIGVGRRIGSAALVADRASRPHRRLHLAGSRPRRRGVAAGFERADPIVGLVITVAILVVLQGAAREVLHRRMDAVDSNLVDRAEPVLTHVVGVQAVGAVRLRWIGHGLYGEANIVMHQDLTVAEGHAIAERARHALLREVPRLADARIHTDPCAHDGSDPHESVAHHYR